MYRIQVPKGTYKVRVRDDKGKIEKKDKGFLDFVQAILQNSKDQSKMVLDEIYLRGKMITEMEALKAQNPKTIELSDDKYKILRNALEEMGTPKIISFQTMQGVQKEETSRWEFIEFPILNKPEICLPFIDSIKNAVQDKPQPLK